MKKILPLLLVMVLLFPLQSLAGGREVKVIILHTNDMHSKIDGMARLAYLADSLRKIHPYLFLVSAGDNFTGNPVVDLVPEKGAPMIEIMNRCGFAVSAIGNHEFDMGQEMMARRISQAAFPFISCNIDAKKAAIPQPQPYLVLKAGDQEIAFLGVVQLNENGIPDTHPSNLEGVRFSDGLVKMQEYKGLRANHSALIGLTHLGVEDDKQLAGLMPELDVILGGHSHTVLSDPLTVNGVLIAQAGAHMRNIGKLTLTFTDGKLSGRSDELIAVASLTREDSVVRSLIDKYNSNPEFSRVVGKAAEPINGHDELGSLMADAVNRQLGLDITLQNKGGIRIWSLPAGEITLKQIYQLDPFGNQVVVMRMKPDELKSLLIYGYTLEKGIDFQAAGMTYRIVTNSEGQCTGAELFDPEGKPLDPDREYRVGLSNYVAVTYKFKHRDPGETLNTTTSQALIDYLGKSGAVNYTGVKRAEIR